MKSELGMYDPGKRSHFHKVWLSDKSETWGEIQLVHSTMHNFVFKLSPALDAALLFAPMKTRLKLVQNRGLGRDLFTERGGRKVVTRGGLFLAIQTSSGEELLAADMPNEWPEEKIAVQVSQYLGLVAKSSEHQNVRQNLPPFSASPRDWQRAYRRY